MVISLAFLAATCSTSDSGETVDPATRLRSLGEAWLENSATVSYSTLVHAAGSATSVHQCLRQVVETSVETAIRMCNPKGELTLSWDPPERWRMDVSNDRGTSTLLSVPAGAYRCHEPAGGARVCAQTTAMELMTEAPFGAVLLPPWQILHTLGSGAAEALTARPEKQIAGLEAECFSVVVDARDGDVNGADWCYSKDGVLLWSRLETSGDVAQVEAIDVSAGVSETAFTDPSR